MSPGEGSRSALSSGPAPSSSRRLLPAGFCFCSSRTQCFLQEQLGHHPPSSPVQCVIWLSSCGAAGGVKGHVEVTFQHVLAGLRQQGEEAERSNKAGVLCPPSPRRRLQGPLGGCGLPTVCQSVTNQPTERQRLFSSRQR